MKSFFLGLFVVYAQLATAFPVYNLQADSLVQQVAKGLNSSPPPAVLSDAWASTFLLLFIRAKSATQPGATQVGSAFVVNREVEGNVQTLDLLTADHVLGNFCDEAQCSNAFVFAGGVIDTNGSDWTPRKSWLPSPNIRVLARSPRNDLALIRITTSLDVNAPPLPIAEYEAAPGDHVYAVGYPKGFLRKDKSGIPQPNVIRLRWSEGEVIGTYNYRQLAGTYLTTDADALPGNSGGPVLNARGEVTGVLGMTGSIAATGFNYVDTPYGENQGIQGSAIRLAQVRAFLNWVH